MLKYKDYQGSVTYSDGKLVIKILHIDDTITDEVDSAANAQAAFEDLVDDYLETCALVGKEASKPFKGSFNVRIPPALHRSAAMAASASHESLNSWVEKAIERQLSEPKGVVTAEEVAGLLLQSRKLQEHTLFRPIAYREERPASRRIDENMIRSSMRTANTKTPSKAGWNA